MKTIQSQTIAKPTKPVGSLSAWARFLLGSVWLVFWSIPLIIASILALPWRSLRIRLGNLYGKIVGSAIARITGTKTVMRDGVRLADYGPAIFISNHTSSLDMFVSMWKCPFGGCGIAKKEIARVPFFGLAYKLSGHLLIDRSNRENSIAALKDLADIVRQNRLSIWIWPEGTRSKDGRLQRMKKGFAHLAIATGLPVVPVVMHGGHWRWPNPGFSFRPGFLELEVLPPIDTSEWTIENIEEHVQLVWDQFNQALTVEQRPVPA